MISIKLNNIVFEGKHGVYEKEKTTPQRFQIDIVIMLDSDAAGSSKELADTIDWATLKTEIQELIAGENLLLAESIANDAARLILEKKHAKKVTVEVAKLDAWGGGENGFPSAVVTKER